MVVYDEDLSKVLQDIAMDPDQRKFYNCVRRECLENDFFVYMKKDRDFGNLYRKDLFTICVNFTNWLCRYMSYVCRFPWQKSAYFVNIFSFFIHEGKKDGGGVGLKDNWSDIIHSTPQVTSTLTS